MAAPPRTATAANPAARAAPAVRRGTERSVVPRAVRGQIIERRVERGRRCRQAGAVEGVAQPLVEHLVAHASCSWSARFGPPVRGVTGVDAVRSSSVRRRFRARCRRDLTVPSGVPIRTPICSREVRPVVEDDDHTLVGIEGGEPAEQGIPFGNGAEWIRGDGRIDARAERDEGDRPAATKAIAAPVHEDSVEPARKPSRSRTVPAERHAAQCVLDRVLGFEGVPQDQPRQAIGAVQVATSKLQEPGVGVVQRPVVARRIEIVLGFPGDGSGRTLKVGTYIQTSDGRERFARRREGIARSRYSAWRTGAIAARAARWCVRGGKDIDLRLPCRWFQSSGTNART